jgi:hypothetical protein
MDVDALMMQYGIDTARDVGRRNNFLSWVQEHLVARAMGVVSDGRTGQPDITVGARTLECRIVSPRACGGATLAGSWSQISADRTVDYVYIVASRDMTSFAFLHIPDVSIGDFRPPTKGHGGKAYMMRHAVVDRLMCLHGTVSVTPNGFRIGLLPL